MTNRSVLAGLVLGAVALSGASLSRTRAGQRALDAVSVNSDDIGGVVTSSKGPEAGVWVIAETTDLPTKLPKDRRHRRCRPLPAAGTAQGELTRSGCEATAWWTRKPLTAKPGKTLALTAVIAPIAQAAAQYYPGDYWYSLLENSAQKRLPT